MNKKGFTLIELLAVVVILGAIALIFIPDAIKILSSNETKIYKAKENIFVNAAKDYVMLNEDFTMPTEASPNKYITTATLVNNNLMSKVLDTTSGNECNGFVRITVNTTYGYNYEACLLCDSYTTSKDFCTSATYNSI